MQRRSRTSRSAARRHGLTLVELLVVIAIIGILSALVVVGTKTLMAAQARSVADQQLTVIAAAIDRYANFWPKWKTGSITVADKGWPHPIPGQLFDAAVFDTNGTAYADWQFDIFVAEDTLIANICLAYSLTEESGKGPYLDFDDDGALFQDIGQVAPTVAPLLPAITGQGGARRARVLVDPWGTPYRYFWAYRNTDAFNGYLPVLTTNVALGIFHKADRFVIESACPNRKFGNVWQLLGDVTQQDKNEAFDNLVFP